MMIIAGIVALLCFTYSAEGNGFFQKNVHFEFQDTKGVFIIRTSKKARQKKRGKGTNNDLQKIHIKLKIE
jgi:hypothetical protein